MNHRGAVVFAALLCGSCTPRPMALPSGASLPARDAAEALQEATSACGAVSTITAEIAVAGSVGGRRLRVRLLAGFAPPASARLEAVAPFGSPLFIFTARNADATLLLPRDRRIVEHGRPEAVLEAVAGVPIDAADLRVALIGCAIAPRPADGKQFGDDWRVVPDGTGEVYLHRDSHLAPWRLVSAVRRRSAGAAWRAEYRDFQKDAPVAGLPAAVRLMNIDGGRFDLRLTLSQVEINAALGAEVFTIQIPRDTDPMTLDELRRSGPLAGSSGGR